MLKEVKILFYFSPPLFDVCENELENISSRWHASASCELHAQGREVATLSVLSGPFLLQPVSVGTSSRHRWSVCRDFIGSNIFLCHETQVSH